jgi:tRNA threonylcarbamoyladenosine biosynthesis protein TsaE
MILRFRDLAELDAVAGQLIDTGRSHSVWLFDGEMGAERRP